jgi:hypothetical protein
MRTLRTYASICWVQIRWDLTWCRCWSLGPLVATGLLAAAGWFVIPEGPVPVPAGGGVESLLWPLLPALVVLAVPAVLANAGSELELLTARSPLLLRLRALGCCALVLAGVAAAGVRFDPVVVWRNTAILAGVAFLAAATLPRGSAWQPVVLLSLACWLLGTDAHRQVRPWAILLAPGSSASASIAAASLLGLGVTGYLGAPRGQHQS